MILDNFREHDPNRKKLMAIVGVATALLLLGSVFTVIATNTAYAAKGDVLTGVSGSTPATIESAGKLTIKEKSSNVKDDKKDPSKRLSSVGGTIKNSGSSSVKITTPAGKKIVKEIGKPLRIMGDQLPPFSVPFSQAAATIEKEFPDSEITSGQRQYLTIKTKSSPPRLPSPGEGGNDADISTMTPAYIFNLVKTNDIKSKNVVAVNGTSGAIIPLQQVNNYHCHYVGPWVQCHAHDQPGLMHMPKNLIPE